ncbi:hypothetical protein I6A84_11060, partial [Frankia sp. CNm7]|nr:hypothetical protein [Frankia nepalensis]
MRAPPPPSGRVSRPAPRRRRRAGGGGAGGGRGDGLVAALVFDLVGIALAGVGTLLLP